MAEYLYQFKDGSKGNRAWKQDATGAYLKNDAGGFLEEGKLLGQANGQGGYTPGFGAIGYGGYDANGKAPAPAPAPGLIGGGGGTGGPSWGGGSGAASPSPAPATGGGSSSSSSGGLIAGNIAPAPLASPTAWNVTGDQTVAGQIKSLTDPNSALAQQYQTAGVKQAASRGLLNSSMAATAGLDSLLRGITPIATSDAETYAKAAGYNADQANQFSQLAYTQGNAWADSQANRQNALALAGLNNNASMAQAQLSAETQRYIAGLNNESSQTLAKLNNEYQAALNAEKNRHDALLQTSSAAASAYQQYANAMLNIQIQPSMNAKAKAEALYNARNAYTFAMEAAYKLSQSNIPDFSGLLDFPPEDEKAAAPKPGPGPVDNRSAEDINAGNGA